MKLWAMRPGCRGVLSTDKAPLVSFRYTQPESSSLVTWSGPFAALVCTRLEVLAPTASAAKPASFLHSPLLFEPIPLNLGNDLVFLKVASAKTPGIHPLRWCLTSRTAWGPVSCLVLPHEFSIFGRAISVLPISKSNNDIRARVDADKIALFHRNVASSFVFPKGNACVWHVSNVATEFLFDPIRKQCRVLLTIQSLFAYANGFF